MDLQNRTFPYPVLCDWSGDYKDGSVFEVEIKAALDMHTGKCKITFWPTLRNKELQRLIMERKVAVFCNVECSETAYRESFRLEIDQPSIVTFETGMLCGRVEFCPAITALECIPDYRNTFDEDYGDCVHIEAGLMLAIARQCFIIIETSNNLLAFIPSVFVLSPLGDNATSRFELDYNKDQINLKVDKDLYRQYKALNTSSQNRGFLVSVIFLPALVMILSKLQTITEQDDPNFSEFEDYKWFFALNRRVKDLFGKEITDANLYNPQTLVLEIANKLLGYPASNSFAMLLERGGEE